MPVPRAHLSSARMTLFAPSDRPEVAESRSAGLARTIRKAIVDGRLPAGHPLREGELARELGTSRTPIREALLLLQAEGLIEAVPNRGAVVKSFDGRRPRGAVRAARRARGLRARGWPRRASPRARSRTSSAAATATRRSPQAHELAALTEENFEFHAGIHKAAGSPRLMDDGPAAHRRAADLPVLHGVLRRESQDRRRRSPRGHGGAEGAGRRSRRPAHGGARRWAGDQAIAHLPLLPGATAP